LIRVVDQVADGLKQQLRIRLDSGTAFAYGQQSHTRRFCNGA